MVGLPREDRAEPVGDVGVVVEAEYRVGLRQRLRQVLSVPLGEAADGHDGLGAAGLLEVGRLEEGVDRVLLRGLHEAARVDHDGVGILRVADQPEAAGLEPTRELFGVDLVAGAAEGHHRDGEVAVIGRVRVVSVVMVVPEYAACGASRPKPRSRE